MKLWLAYAPVGSDQSKPSQGMDAEELAELDGQFSALCSRERAEGLSGYGGRGGAWVTPRALAALLADLRPLPAVFAAAPDKAAADSALRSSRPGRLEMPGFGPIPLPVGKGEVAPPAPPKAEASQHSAAEAAREVADVEFPPEGERTAAGLAARFQALADHSTESKAQARKVESVLSVARRKVAQALAAARLAAPALEQLRQTAPDLYRAVVELADSVAALARASTWSPLSRAEQAAVDVAAAAPRVRPARAGAKHPEVPVGTQVEGTGRFKVRHLDGTTGWRQARSGMILSRDPAQHAASALRPGAK